MTGLDDTLQMRRSQHGDFTDHARIAQELKRTMQAEPSWELLTPTQRESLEMIQHKIARILAGNPNHADHWVDIEGYSRIARERLTTRIKGDDDDRE